MKKFKELFASFLEEPSREKLRAILQENFGESNELDFKEDIGDFSKLAKHILAIANKGGGAIIIGVRESEVIGAEAIGVSKFVDQADIFKKTNKFIPPQLSFDVLNFDYKETEYAKIRGMKFQVIFIDKRDEYIPFISMSDGKFIRKNAIYTRVGTNSDEVDYHQLQEILNRRLQTEHINSSEIELSAHIQELKELYNHLEKYKYLGGLASLLSEAPFLGERKLNDKYPTEDFEEFIISLIDKKKELIKGKIR